jgi:hypothetical protein
MQLLKKLAAAAAIASVASYASAGMTPIADSDLSKVSGQDGVSIAADLHINIGEFKYTNTSAGGGSVSFKNIGINGVIGATLDVISGAAFGADAFGTVLGITSTPTDVVTTGFYDGTSDVVKIAIPNITSSKNVNMSVGAISMGNSTKSFGAMAMNDIKLQGTTVYIWAH